MKVTLLAKTMLTPEGASLAQSGRNDQGIGSDAEKLSEIAGRECYDSWGAGRASAAYHDHIIEVGHGSVLAHANYTFRIEGISRNLAIELLRHHVGTNPSQRSTRYCDESETPVVRHPLLEQFLEAAAEDDAEGLALLECIQKSEQFARAAYRIGVPLLEKHLVDKGVSKLVARKQARGAMARHLPNGLETSIVFTMNVRAARNIIEQRGVAADAEIRAVAAAMYQILSEDSPAFFKDYQKIEADDGLGPAYETEHRKI